MTPLPGAPIFEWDEAKARSNARKHGVSSDEAKTAFADTHALLIDDPDHSVDEDRFLLLGMSAVARVLVVATACGLTALSSGSSRPGKPAAQSAVAMHAE